MIKGSKIGKETSTKIGSVLKFLPIHPTSITLISVILAISGFLVIYYERSLVSQMSAFALFLFAFLFDVVDGAIARAKNLVSKKGGFYDGIADRLVEFLLIFSLVIIYSEIFNFEMIFVLIAILFFGTGMTSFVKAYSEHQGILKNEEAKKLPGLLERAERSILLLLAMLMIILQQFDYARIDLLAIAALSLITFLQRFVIVASKKE